MSSERCHCGGSKNAWAIACKACWFLVPKPLRHRYFAAREGSAAKRETLHECLTIIRRPRAPKPKPQTTYAHSHN